MPRHRSKSPHQPKYRKHSSGQAMVELNGQRHYLGRYETTESRERYHALLAEWEAHGRRLPRQPGENTDGLLVVQIIADYWDWATGYFVHSDGTSTSRLSSIKVALRLLREHYAHLPACQFSPNRLRTLQYALIKQKVKRTTVNNRVGIIKHCFKWAVSHEMVSPSVWHGLQAVDGLRAGRSAAPESNKVRPVRIENVEAVLPYVSTPIAALIRLQLATAARGGELLIMRAVDIDMSEDVWVYRPQRHKTQHHGHERTIYLGPTAQSIIQPFLTGRSLDAYLFSAKEGEAEHRARKHAARSTQDAAALWQPTGDKYG